MRIQLFGNSEQLALMGKITILSIIILIMYCKLLEKNYCRVQETSVMRRQLKATEEYKKYQVQNLSPVKEEYLETVKNLHSIA